MHLRSISRVASVFGNVPKNVLLKMQSRFVSGNSRKNLRIGVQGVELFMGQPRRGTELGPKVIRETGVIQALQLLGHDLIDYGNVPIMELQEADWIDMQMMSTNVGRVVTGVRRPQTLSSVGEKMDLNTKNVKQIADTNRLISQGTAKILEEGRVCLTLGGDHALGIGTVHGASQVHPDLSVLWIDAHADINTPLTSESGNMHGMSVSFFLKELQSYLTKFPEFSSWLQPRVSASSLAYIGLRDVDPAEATILEMLGIAAYSMKDVDKHGIEKVMEMALDTISRGKSSCPIHVSYDIDSLCNSIVKSTGTPVPGGLTLREGITLLEMVHETGRLVSMDLVEVNPLLGTQADVLTTAQAAKHLILSAFGHNRGGTALNSIPKP